MNNNTSFMTQALIQLAKQNTHDSVKTGQTADVVQKIVEVSSHAS
jgi:hypothetical protein